MLRILLLEDSLFDTELIHAQLIEGEIECELVRVETRTDFQKAIESDSFGLILADYALPSFDGISALEIARTTCPDVPFIFVSATLGEEVAIETLKSGATDYVLKQRLQRLVPSVHRALREAKEHRDRLRAEAALRESERRFRLALKSSSICVFQQDRALRYEWIHNPQTAHTVEQILGKSDYDLFPYEQAEWLTAIKCQVLESGIATREEVCLTAKGEIRSYDLLVEPVTDEREQVVAITCAAVDITDRKQAEREIYRREQQFRALAENAPDIIARLDKQLRHIYINPAIERVTGMSPESYIGKTNEELGFSSEIVTLWNEICYPLFISKQAGFLEFDFPSPNGMRSYQSRMVPEFDFQGGVESLLCITRDVTEFKKAEQAIRESEARFRRLMDSNTIGMGFWTGDIITAANDAFLKIVGYSQEDLQAGSLNWHNMTPPEYWPVDETFTQEVMKTGFCPPMEKELIRRDGNRVPVIVGGAGFDSGNAREGVFFALDLSERKQMEKALQKQAEELGRANRVKDEFLAVLSHELRSPLNAILGWSKLLLTREFDEASTRKALETIERNAKSQTQLIEDLLDVSRILSGKLSLNVSEVNLGTAIETAMETVRLAAEAKSIQLDTLIDSTVVVFGDASRLQQVIWNLLSNAVKFTPNGGRVTIVLQQHNGYAQICVRDTGQGIRSDFIPYLFDYFRQADASSTRQHGGLGIGLGIVRHLVELHGGTVSAESGGESQGATFTVHLPLMKVKSASAEDDSVPLENEAELAGVKVLVVDDDADSLELLSFTLEEYGCEVRAIASAAEALETLSGWIPHVLVSDIGMPQEDGYSLIRKIRSLSGDRGGLIPALALTAYAREQDRMAALSAGFQEHLAKPVNPTDLIAVITRLTQFI